MTDVSVVIGFRDWGSLRLKLAISSIRASFGPFNGEIILSDFGSESHDENAVLADELGAKYVYTPREVNWSRSRALNAGFAVANGNLLVSTDADMIFSPTSFARIVEIAQAEPRAAYFLQCRDLPEGMDDRWVLNNPNRWDELEAESRLRPRWGMGGMMAIGKSGFDIIRGFDERLHTYGGEDLDFAQRARRAGYRTMWINDPQVRMYHMWHKPTLRTVNETDAGRAAVEFNRNIVHEDSTYVRNLKEWMYRRGDEKPIVSVAISTFNRADYLKETLQSVLTQTVQDFEVIVVDDGGEDHAKEVVASFNDERIHYYWKENGGISSARNFAADRSNGLFTAVIDDDDLMHPKRLEWQLAAMDSGLAGNVGCFINFDDATGEMHLFIGKNPTAERSIPKGSAPGHGTWMIKTDIVKKIRYDERLSSGVDNNFFLRMLRSGYVIAHTGKPLTLRRMHLGQVTKTDSGNQTAAAEESLNFLRWGFDNEELKKAAEVAKQTPEWPQRDNTEHILSDVRTYLPDHLVTRNVIMHGELPSKDKFEGTAFEMKCEVLPKENGNENGRLEREQFLFSRIIGATYGDMVRLRSAGAEYDVVVSESTEKADTDSPTLQVLAMLKRHYGERIEATFFVPVEDDSLAKYRVIAGSKSQVRKLISETENPAGIFVVSDEWLGN